MILFFTGTGNSRHIARKIADSLGEVGYIGDKRRR